MICDIIILNDSKSKLFETSLHFLKENLLRRFIKHYHEFSVTTYLFFMALILCNSLEFFKLT